MNGFAAHGHGTFSFSDSAVSPAETGQRGWTTIEPVHTVRLECPPLPNAYGAFGVPPFP